MKCNKIFESVYLLWVKQTMIIVMKYVTELIVIIILYY